MLDAQIAVTDAPIPFVSDDRRSRVMEGPPVRGFIWTATGYGASQALRFGFNLILTRLLFPELFGLMTLVFTVMSGLQLFLDAGITPAVVRSSRGDESAFVNTAWTMQVLRGLLITCGGLALTYPMASFYGDHRLRWVVPIISVCSLISGFNSSSLMRLQRHMRVFQLMTIELVIQLIAGVVMVLWAWLRPSIWPLIAGTIVPTVLRMLWSHALMRDHPVRPAWDRLAIQELSQFGRWIWAASVLMFLASQVDRLILGKLFSLKLLGIYSIALSIAEFPRGLATAMNGNVFFPTYSKQWHLPRSQFRALVLHHRRAMLVVIGCCVLILVVGGDTILRLLYDKRYSGDAWMLPMLAFGLWPAALAHTIDTSLVVVGRPAYAAIGNLVKLLFTAIGVPLAFWTWGAPGSIIVVALNDLAYYLPIAYGLRREGLSGVHQDLNATALLIGVLACALVLRWLCGGGLPIQGAL